MATLQELETQLNSLQNEEKKKFNNQMKKLSYIYRQKEIEDYQRQIILKQKKMEIIQKKKLLFQNNQNWLVNEESSYNKLIEEQKINKSKIKQLLKEEEMTQTELLPYLKFKTSSKNIKPTHFYDMIVHCSSIQHLLKYGWRIQSNHRYTKIDNITGKNNLQELIDKFNQLSYQLGIIGNANMGKSFFISQVLIKFVQFLQQLCQKKFRAQGIETPTGMTVSTQGLSVIKFEFEKNRILDILDSEGFHAPIQYEQEDILDNQNEMDRLDKEIEDLNQQFYDQWNAMSPEEQKEIENVLEQQDPAQLQQLQQPKQDMIDRLQQLNTRQLNKQIVVEDKSKERQDKFNDRQVSEKLIQQYIIKSSSMIIIMVGDLTINEQKLIEQVINIQENRPIIVIHNLHKIQQFQELNEKAEININKSFQVYEQTYVNGFKYYQGIQKVQDIVKYREIFHIPFGYQADEALLEAIKIKSNPEYQEHLKINKQNQQAMEFIQDKINFYYANLSQLQKRSLSQSLKDHFQENITDYLDLTVDSSNQMAEELKKKFNNLEFQLKQENKEQILYSSELINLNEQKLINLKYFNFDSNNQIVTQPGQDIKHFYRINPKYSLLINRSEKKINVWIEMPPISNDDKDRLRNCSQIIKDSESYILRIRGFKRLKENFWKLFNIQNGSQLTLAPTQASDSSRQYKIEGVIEVDIILCSSSQMLVFTTITDKNIDVSEGVAKFTIPFEFSDDQEDPEEIYE